MEHTNALLKYTADIGDLSLSLFIPSMADYKSIDFDSPSLFHTHSYIEIFVCLEGEITLKSERGEVKLFRNDIAFMPAAHQHAAIPEANCSYFNICIIGTKTQSKSIHSVYKEYSELFENESARIYRKATKSAVALFELYTNKEVEKSPIPAIKAAAALVDLARTKDYDSLDLGQREKSGYTKSDISTYLIIEEIINCHFTEEIRYSEITKRLHISRRHLDRLVREKYGKTLRFLIYNSRISFAKNLLCETDMSLDAIAFRVGFSSTASFRKCFQDIVGMKPTEYRRMQ